jgi:uncharacterized protein YciI
MKRLIAPLLVLAVLVSALAPAVALAQSKYESDLYFIVLAERGPTWKPQSTEDGLKKKMQAIEGLKKALGEGNIVIAGLVVDDVAADFVMIVDAENEMAVREALKNAPLVKEGFYKLRSLAWQAPKGLKLEPVPLNQ